MKPEARAERLFAQTFGRDPAAVASAPGRINLIGEHVDYHGGHVMPCAIGERTAVAVGPADGFVAVSEHAEPARAPWPPRRLGNWSDYLAGVADQLGPDAAPWARGMAAAVASDLTPGAGLGSSAALAVAAALSLLRWSGRALGAREVADLAWRAETGFCGVPCGRMDQLAAVLPPAGSAILLDCRSMDVMPVPVAVDLVLADSGETHTLRDSAYAERRREGAAALALLQARHQALGALVDLPPARLAAAARTLPAPLDLRVRHVVNENQRVMLAARALERNDLEGFGVLVSASHDSLRDLYQCSTGRLDAIVTAARAVPGVLGSRLVGAGWGGSVLVVARPGTGAAVAEGLAASGTATAVRASVPGAGAMAPTA